jgi:hypothetical protein
MTEIWVEGESGEEETRCSVSNGRPGWRGHPGVDLETKAAGQATGRVPSDLVGAGAQDAGQKDTLQPRSPRFH